MAPTPNQKAGKPKEALQRQWDQKQSWGIAILHRLRKLHWNNKYQAMLLLVRPRRTQSYIRVPLVCGCATKHQLEVRMD
jgi:hypothetical protein